jgi:PAS domain S-box-containing protein
MNFLFKLPLRISIPVILIVFSTLVSLGVTLDRLYREEADIRSTSQHDMIEMMQQLRDGISDRILHGDIIAANMRLSDAALSRNINGIYLVDAEGSILLSSQYAMRGVAVSLGLPEYNAAEARESLRLDRSIILDSDDNKHMYGYFPVVLGQIQGALRPNRYGMLFVDYDLGLALDQARSYALRQSLTFFLSFMLMIGFLVLFFRWRVTRRVTELAEVVTRFSGGVLDRHAEVSGGDEITDLARAFNGMADRLTEKNRELHNEIEERSRVAVQLSESRQMLQLVLDSIPVGVFWKDCNLRYLGCNRLFARDAGLHAPEEVVGLSEGDLSWREFAQRYEEDDRAVIVSGEARLHAEEMNRLRSGATVWLQISKLPLVDGQGQITGLLGTYQDITARKQAELSLEELNHTLEQRVKEELAKNREKDHLLIQQSRLAAMGEMVHNIAHQWRQPLNLLGLVVAGIKDDYDHGALDDAALNQAIEQSQRLLQKMSTTIDDFRYFFRPDKEKQTFDIAEVVDATFVLMEASFKNNRITISQQLERPMLVEGYPSQYSQALLNILVNAKEAILHKDVEHGRIDVSLRAESGWAVLCVEDNGGGIPPQVMGRLFDPYFTTKEQGSGIGLYMTKMIIENSMDGKVWAENAGEGARFTIRLPLLLASKEKT